MVSRVWKADREEIGDGFEIGGTYLPAADLG
jgi:hypothetical protein